jgi:transcription-repair coupling factor (superfamily II helicase)
VLTLGAAARLDGVKLAALVQRSRGLYRLTPDMKLVARVDDTVKGEAWVGAARKVLTDLDRCAA